MHNDHSVLWHIAVIIILITLNSFFVLSEVAILTSNKVKLQKIAQHDKKKLGATRALRIMREPELFLSTMQVAITLVNILLGLYGGVSIGEHISMYVQENVEASESSLEYINWIAAAISTLMITYFTVLTEIVPKRIAMLSPEKIASIVSYPMIIFIKMMYPLTFILTKSVKLCMKILKIREGTDHVSVDEIRFVINQAAHSGILANTERNMMNRLINLGGMQVGAIMTPRSKIVALDVADTDQNNINKLKQNFFSSFPVIDGALNNVIGIIHVHKLIHANINKEMIVKLAKESQIVYVPEIARVTKLIELLKEKQMKIALVLDEYGETEGIVTFNDILKTFLGDLGVFVGDNHTANVTKKGNDNYVVHGNILIEEVHDLIQVSSLPGDDEEDYRTLAGFVLHQFGKLPSIGDSFNAMGWSFKILKMDNLRIDRVLITKLSQNDQNGDD